MNDLYIHGKKDGTKRKKTAAEVLKLAKAQEAKKQTTPEATTNGIIYRRNKPIN